MQLVKMPDNTQVIAKVRKVWGIAGNRTETNTQKRARSIAEAWKKYLAISPVLLSFLAKSD